MALADLFPEADIGAMRERMSALMDAEGLPFGSRTHTYNSRKAQEVAKWAEGHPGGEAVHDAFYRAYFVEGQNLADEGVLAAVVDALGLDADEAMQALREGRFKDAVGRDWARARALGVTGVPTFVAGRRGVVGAQPYEVLEQLVGAAGAEPR
jgi:predicted DsbA family dithiol-disulfide isomerase